MIRVFVVEDSEFLRRALARVFGQHVDISICAESATGRDAIARYDTFGPDLVLLDVELPDMDGAAVLRALKERDPGVRALIMSAQASMDQTLEALSLGALDFVDRSRFGVLDVDGFVQELLGKVRLLGERVRRTTRPTTIPPSRTTGTQPALPPIAQSSRKSGAHPALLISPAPAPVPVPAEQLTSIEWSRYDLVCIGASTGGPPALESILRALPAEFPAPLAIVQHMPPAFTRSFAERLARSCRISVHEAVGGEKLEPGMAVLAPGGAHMRVSASEPARVGGFSPGAGERSSTDLTIELLQASSAGHIPSVDELMRSAATARGKRVVAILLTGMGEDGAEGMATVRAAGGLTIAETEASCVVYGMPRAAHQKGAVQHMLPLAEIRRLLSSV